MTESIIFLPLIDSIPFVDITLAIFFDPRVERDMHTLSQFETLKAFREIKPGVIRNYLSGQHVDNVL